MVYIKNLIYLCSEEGLPIRAHLMGFIECGILPSYAIIWKKNNSGSLIRSKLKRMFPKMAIWYKNMVDINRKNSKTDVEYSEQIFGRNIFNKSSSPINLLNEANIPHKIVYANNINDQSIINELNNINCEYVIVAKAGGILRENIFSTKKKFINAHKGYLPDFKGSSPTHWSILSSGHYGSTIHFIDKGIDTGSIIKRRKFDYPKLNSLNQIKVYEAHIVSEVLSDVLADIHKNGKISGRNQDNNSEKAYYKPHPLLIDISLSAQLGQEINNNMVELEILIEKIQDIKKYRKINLVPGNKLIETLESELNANNFENNLAQEIYGHFLYLNSNGKESEENIQKFLVGLQKQVDLGWRRKTGIRKTSSVLSLNKISLLLLTYLYNRMYETVKDIRLLNSSCKLYDNLRFLDFMMLSDVETTCLYVVTKDLFTSLENIKSELLS